MTALQDPRYDALGFIKVRVIQITALRELSGVGEGVSDGEPCQIENLFNDAYIINAIEKAALIAIDSGATRADLRDVGLSDKQINKIINNEVEEVEDDSETI